MFKLTSIACALLLTGCATCQNHPVFCAVGTAIIVGSVAATIEDNRHHEAPEHHNDWPAACNINPQLCR
jgi:hypothetical protein